VAVLVSTDALRIAQNIEGFEAESADYPLYF
jgi:hypothetical protein